MRMSTASGGGGGGRGGGFQGGGFRGGGFRGGGGGRNERGPGPGGGRGFERGGGGGSGLPHEILARLRLRRKNLKVVSLDFKVPNMPSLPDEEEVWDWLAGLNLTDDENHEIDYFEREVIEKKYYICMKEEQGAEWLAGKFEEGLKFKVPDEQGQEVTIKGKKEGEHWTAVVVRGVHPNTEIMAIETVFKQFGDVKGVAFVSMGPRKVKSNKLTLKVKLEEGKLLPGFVMAPIGGGTLERWEVICKGLGGQKVCLQCYQQGHVRKECPNQAPTMADVVAGKVPGGTISYAQALAGTMSNPVVPAPKPAMQPTQTQEHTAAREGNANSMEKLNPTLNAPGGTAMPVGTVSGEPVSNLLISSVATTTQALEVPIVAKAHTTAREGNANSMGKLNPTLNAPGGTTMPVGANTGDTVEKLLSPDIPENSVKQAPVGKEAPSSTEFLEQIKSGEIDSKVVEEEIKELRSKLVENQQNKEEERRRSKERKERRRGSTENKEVRKESLKRKSRGEGSGERGEGSGERARSSSEKRKKEEGRKSRENYPPHKSRKDSSASRRQVSPHHGSGN